MEHVVKQSPQVLESGLREAFNLSGEDRKRSAMRVLLDYCAYEDYSGPDKPDPFDDPYVAAALITSEGVLISSHRKERQNERHAEAKVLFHALEAIQVDEAKEVAKELESGFLDKVWLRSNNGREAFLALFRRAGNLVRDKHGSDLILLSSLEPCNHFEAQPACSELIVSFGPSEVWYGCDDSNPDGRGRPTLEKGGINVSPNLTPELNLAKNALFYASTLFIPRLIRTWEERGRMGNQYLVHTLGTGLRFVSDTQDETRRELESTSLEPTYNVEPRSEVSPGPLTRRCVTGCGKGCVCKVLGLRFRQRIYADVR